MYYCEFEVYSLMIYLFPLQTVQRPSTGGAGGAAERAAPPRRALQERGRQARIGRRPRRMPRRSQKGKPVLCF